MQAMLLERIQTVEAESSPLRLTEVPIPTPADDEVLIRVHVCGVCHTELDEIEGRTPPRALPLILGHQVVGMIEDVGQRVQAWSRGTRVGVAWIYQACGACAFCQSGRENLCPHFEATGRDRHGGYAEFLVAKAAFVYEIPESFSDSQAAPLLCAGAIGYRSLALTGLRDGQALGLTGFGASAHLVMKLARHRFPNARIHVFARNERERAFARELGAVWAGDTTDRAPELLDAVIDTTPAWVPVVAALDSLAPGGRLVINAIRKDDADQPELANIDYARHLWMEKEIKSVANVTRRDVQEFLSAAADLKLSPHVREYALPDANRALWELKSGASPGAKVLVVGGAAPRS